MAYEEVMTYEEVALMYKLAMMGVYNGNHIETKAFDPDPREYKMLCQIANKLEEQMKTLKQNK